MNSQSEKTNGPNVVLILLYIARLREFPACLRKTKSIGDEQARAAAARHTSLAFWLPRRTIKRQSIFAFAIMFDPTAQIQRHEVCPQLAK